MNTHTYTKLMLNVNKYTTRIPSGIWSCLLPAKFDHESLYEPIKFETLQPYLVNK